MVLTIASYYSKCAMGTNVLLCQCVKDRTSYTVERVVARHKHKAFEMILSNMGIPKPTYYDQGSEFKNSTFQKLLDKHNIQIIFALSHAPFIEVFK